MESSHGPGVIGMLMALCVLFVFGALLMFAFDEGLQGVGQPIESFIDRQSKEIAEIKASISHGEKQFGKCGTGAPQGGNLLECAHASDSGPRRRRPVLAAARDDPSKSINAMENEFSLYRERIRETL